MEVQERSLFSLNCSCYERHGYH